jgi:hypothetical protein
MAPLVAEPFTPVREDDYLFIETTFFALKLRAGKLITPLIIEGETLFVLG